jgi:hypothetical protein
MRLRPLQMPASHPPPRRPLEVLQSQLKLLDLPLDLLELGPNFCFRSFAMRIFSA